MSSPLLRLRKGVWRDPDVESARLYPGLVVHDGRVAGSITVGRSRLPLWCFVGVAVRDGWAGVEGGWSPTEKYGFTQDDLATFLWSLLQVRGEFARLLLVLADVERRDQGKISRPPWWDTKTSRKRVADQLRHCAAVLEDTHPAPNATC